MAPPDDYLSACIADCERAKRQAQQQLASAQVLHERAEGGRLVLLQLQETLTQAEAAAAFVRALAGGEDKAWPPED
jgi:hypothetical protein